MPPIVLGSGASVQRNGRHSTVLGCPRGLQKGGMLDVDAAANLYGDGNRNFAAEFARSLLGGANHRGQNLGKVAGFPRQGGTTSLAGDFGNRAAEVQIHVIDQVPRNHLSHAPGQIRPVDPIELERTNGLFRPGSRHGPGLGRTHPQGFSSNHLANEHSFVADQARHRATGGRPRHRRPVLAGVSPTLTGIDCTNIAENRVSHPGHRRQANGVGELQFPDA